MAISSFVGYLLAAAPFSTVPDRVSAWLTRKNNNIHEAEYRLWCLAVVFFVSPAALILYGYSAGNHLHWFGLVFAVGMFQFGMYYRTAFQVQALTRLVQELSSISLTPSHTPWTLMKPGSPKC